MGVLSELGFGRDEQRAMLIDPPDHVLAEAGGLKPRPSIATSLMTAEPAVRIAWWPAPGRMDAASVSRLHWMVNVADGEGWVVYDPEDGDCASAEEIRAAIGESAFVAGDEVVLGTGERALPLTARPRD